eukprot:2293782-Rhodomonas_salina.1
MAVEGRGSEGAERGGAGVPSDPAQSSQAEDGGEGGADARVRACAAHEGASIGQDGRGVCRKLTVEVDEGFDEPAMPDMQAGGGHSTENAAEQQPAASGGASFASVIKHAATHLRLGAIPFAS